MCENSSGDRPLVVPLSATKQPVSKLSAIEQCMTKLGAARTLTAGFRLPLRSEVAQLLTRGGKRKRRSAQHRRQLLCRVAMVYADTRLLGLCSV